MTANNIRIDVLELLKNAGSGHLGGSFSEAEILSVLFNEHLKFDPNNPKWDKRDRFILSKGHANPGLYAILAEKGFFSKDEFKNLRKINGMLQGHPERITPGIEYIAGFLGQGLSAGCGMALGFKRENKENQVFVLIGDGDNLEGQTWEAARFAVHNKLDNLTAIFDYNNILSDGTTESVLTINEPEKQWKAFGWNVIIVNGHNVIQIDEALRKSKEIDAPTIIIANTRKGHGVSFWDNSPLSHGSWGPTEQEYSEAKNELEKRRNEIMNMEVDTSNNISIIQPEMRLNFSLDEYKNKLEKTEFSKYFFETGEMISLRNAFGMSSANLAEKYSDFDIFDGDVKGGTMTSIFEKHFPNRFIQCGIAEQNMVSAAAGYYLATGRIPIVTTYAVFTSLLTAAQFRNGVALQKIPMIVASSHVGIDTGPDGPTHQAIEDLGIFSTYPNVQVLSPSDANRVQSVLEAALLSKKPTFMRTGRSPVPTIYSSEKEYNIGRDEIVIEGSDVSIFATGIMVHRAIEARDMLKKQDISTEIIDITSVNPLDKETIVKSIKKTNCAVTAEDHYVRNGIGSAISQLISNEYPVFTHNIGLNDYAESGSPEDLALKYGLTSKDIMNAAKDIIKRK
ncbi:transketolase [Candidatus Nitrosopelagicus sp.]|nr:transketolase [Candidatus Nitrosopelagicus sp.]